MDIRKAVLSDCTEIAGLTEQLGYSGDAEKAKTILTGVLSQQDYGVFVGTTDEKVIGWIQLHRVISLETGAYVEIMGLVVDDQYRGQGLGRLLVKEATDWARSIGGCRLRVRCNVIRTESHKFYESIGFKLKKEQKVFDSLL